MLISQSEIDQVLILVERNRIFGYLLVIKLLLV